MHMYGEIHIFVVYHIQWYVYQHSTHDIGWNIVQSFAYLLPILSKTQTAWSILLVCAAANAKKIVI